MSADEVCDGGSPRFDDTVAQPTHAPGLLDTVGRGEAEVTVDFSPHLVGIEVDGPEPGNQDLGQRGFASPRQTHQQDFA